MAKPDPKKSKESGLLSAESVRMQRQIRWNPIRSLTPESLTRALDGLEYGDLREFALLAEAVANRNDTLKSVKPKREKDVSQLPWQILKVDDSDEAEDHKRVLEDFYNNVTAINAFDRNERGGFSRLVRQMMTAASYRYAGHHIAWAPDSDRQIELASGRKISGLSATLEFCPLYFFENRTGELRFVKDGLGIEGEALLDGEWMVTVGDGLMTAILPGYLMLREALNDWAAFSEKFGTPGVVGRTSASRDSDGGRGMRAAVEAFGREWGAVLYGDDAASKIELIEAKGGATSLPFPALIERIERKFAALYRGADLSTMSSKEGEGSGASLQGEEADILKRDDAQTISETLNHYLDRWVLRHQFGVNQGKAYIQIDLPETKDAKFDLEVIGALVDRGARISMPATLERFGLTEAGDDELDVVQPKRTGNAAPLPTDETEAEDAEAAINARASQREIDRYLRRAEQLLGTAYAAAAKPINAAVNALLSAPDDQFLTAINQFNAELLRIARDSGADDETAEAFGKVISAAVFNGLTPSIK